MALMSDGGGTCATGSNQYTATRFEYAKNGKTVSYVMGESWCWDQVATCPTFYAVTYAREFRYDGARARYINRQLNPSTLATVATTWSDYDGGEAYGDFTVASARSLSD